MYAETVARWFGQLWPYYCKENLDLELLPFWHVEPHASPFFACIVWDRDRWAILADEATEPGRLLEQLFHELGHVRRGHVTKNGYGREVLKRAALGIEALPVVRHSVRASRATAAAAAREADVDEWASRQADRWWRLIAGLSPDISDAEMRWHIRQELAFCPIDK